MEFIFLYKFCSATRGKSLKIRGAHRMWKKMWKKIFTEPLFAWLLPFGDKCDPRCESELHNAYCFIFPTLGVVLGLSLIGCLRGVFSFEFLSRYSLGYQSSMIFSLVAFLGFFAATWRYQRKITMYLWCRRCQKMSKRMED